jgi:hypothetical protein
MAQPPDTLAQQTIEISSAYKPVVRSAAKIQLTAALLKADTSKSLRPYVVPSQNLFYSYLPITLKPIALDKEEGPELGVRNFVKAGIGTLRTPYMRFGYGIGDGQTYLLNAYGEHISSKSSISDQQYSRTHLQVAGSYFISKNELYGSVGFRRDNYRLFGFDHEKFKVGSDTVLQAYRELNIDLGFRNKEIGSLGLQYDPRVTAHFFTLKDKLKENSFEFRFPVERAFSNQWKASLDAMADITRYSSEKQIKDTISFSNDIIKLIPSFTYKNEPLEIHIGFGPVWDNSKLNFLPDVKLAAKIKENISFLAGWEGNITKNSFRNLSATNPYLSAFTSSVSPSNINTIETEYYGGIRGTFGKHFVFNARAGFVSYNNLPLFINDPDTLRSIDTLRGLGFVIMNEQKASNFRIQGSLSYQVREKFTANAKMVLNAYAGFEERAWHTLPFEFTSYLRWQAFKKLAFRSSMYIFAGSYYKEKSRTSDNDFRMKGGADINLGANYSINKNFNAWIDLNNILNNKYQRWHDYPVFGWNLLGGLNIQF